MFAIKRTLHRCPGPGKSKNQNRHSPAQTWKATASRTPDSAASLVSTAQPCEVSAPVAVGGAWGHPAHPIGQLCLPALCVGHRMDWIPGGRHPLLGRPVIVWEGLGWAASASISEMFFFPFFEFKPNAHGRAWLRGESCFRCP